MRRGHTRNGRHDVHDREEEGITSEKQSHSAQVFHHPAGRCFVLAYEIQSAVGPRAPRRRSSERAIACTSQSKSNPFSFHSRHVFRRRRFRRHSDQGERRRRLLEVLLSVRTRPPPRRRGHSGPLRCRSGDNKHQPSPTRCEGHEAMAIDCENLCACTVLVCRQSKRTWSLRSPPASPLGCSSASALLFLSTRDRPVLHEGEDCPVELRHPAEGC